jgi:hypothetical protein
LLSILSGLIVAAAVVGSAIYVVRAGHASARREPQTAAILALFAPGIDEVRRDPRALLTWQPLAGAARRLYPSEFAALDAAYGGTFPFTIDQIQASHARWSADWLAWERTHDGEYKLKAAEAQDALGDRVSSTYGRMRLDAIEREKLERYQQRYEEYTRVSKALQALIAGLRA